MVDTKSRGYSNSGWLSECSELFFSTRPSPRNNCLKSWMNISFKTFSTWPMAKQKMSYTGTASFNNIFLSPFSQLIKLYVF